MINRLVAACRRHGRGVLPLLLRMVVVLPFRRLVVVLRGGHYDRDFYRYTLAKYGDFSEVFVASLMRCYEIHSAVDVGCGNGLYLKRFQERGVAVRGYEGSRSARKYSLLPAGVIQRCDLRHGVPVPERYDLCLSLEVAEHLNVEYAGRFVKTLVGLSDRIVFSAAHPGQGGLGHVNEQPQAYWIGLFEEQGCRYAGDRVAQIKAELQGHLGAMHEIYPYENLMLFERVEKRGS